MGTENKRIWDRNRTYILGAMGIFLLMNLVIYFYSRDDTDAQTAQIASKSTTDSPNVDHVRNLIDSLNMAYTAKGFDGFTGALVESNILYAAASMIVDRTHPDFNEAREREESAVVSRLTEIWYQENNIVASEFNDAIVTNALELKGHFDLKQKPLTNRLRKYLRTENEVTEANIFKLIERYKKLL